MIRVINGRRYDTCTAERLCMETNGRYLNDFGHRAWTLYRTRRGDYMIHHSGGAMTDMATPCEGGGRCGGERIEAISAPAAAEWLRARADDPAAARALATYFPARREEDSD